MLTSIHFSLLYWFRLERLERNLHRASGSLVDTTVASNFLEKVEQLLSEVRKHLNPDTPGTWLNLNRVSSNMCGQKCLCFIYLFFLINFGPHVGRVLALFVGMSVL